MVPFLLVLVACLGVVEAKFDIAGRDASMKLQNAYPSFPSSPQYLSYKLFTDTSCTQLDQVISFLENTCLAGNEESVKFTCVNGAITKAVYLSDLTCSGTPTKLLPYTTSSTGCTPQGSSHSFQTIACDSSGIDFGPGDYSVIVFNQDSSCTQPLVATGVINNFCYPQDDQSSIIAIFPYAYKYNASGCTGPPSDTMPLGGIEPDSCSFTTGADDDDDDFAKDNSYESIIHYVDGMPSDDSQDKQGSLSDGAIAGIVIGSLAGVALLVLCAMWLLKLGCFAVKAPMSAQQEINKV